MLSHIKKKTGVGSIIGGIFLVLILISGYGFYLMSNQAVNEYQRVASDMRKSDMDRNQEHLSLKVVRLSGETVNIDVINDGFSSVHIVWVAFSESYNSDYEYVRVDYFIEPSSIPTTIPITLNFSPDANGDYPLLLISERGKVYTSNLNPNSFDQGPDNFIQDEVSDIIGKFLPTYLSFQWTSRATSGPGRVTGPFVWNGNYQVVVESSRYLLFRVLVTWCGKTDITLGENTAIYVKQLYGSGSDEIFYIVNYNPNTYTISQFTGQTFYVNDPSTLTQDIYFAVTVPGANPLSMGSGSGAGDNLNYGASTSGTQYSVNLGLFDSNGIYSQSFPLIALITTNDPLSTTSLYFDSDYTGSITAPIGDWTGTTVTFGNHRIYAGDPISGYVFSHWDADNPSITFTDPKSPYSIATIIGSGTIKAVYELN